jgi:uncharacterized repeat protein (TIGR03803 family)
LFRDAAGNLYGTTGGGGASGQGTVYKLSPSGKEKVLYAFTGGADGGSPSSGLLRDAAGNFYGAAFFGGIGGFNGVVFKLDPTGKETPIYSFTGGADGANPVGNLVLDNQGNLYGATVIGGQACSVYPFAPSCGVVYKLALK